MGIFFSDEAEAMVLQVMVSHSGISIESSQNPFQKLIIIRIPQLNMEPLRPSFEPTVRAFHISISPRTVYFTGSGLYLKGKMIIIFFFQKKKKNCYFQFLRIFGFVLVPQSLCFSYSLFFPLVLSSSYPKIEISLTPCLFPVPSLDSDKSNNVSFFLLLKP